MSQKLPITVGTIGQPTYGKTTLTAAITSFCAAKFSAEARGYDEIDAAEEKFYNIAIQMARVQYETEKRAYHHIDFRNSIDYIKALMTGAAALDAAILVVSALEGTASGTRDLIVVAKQAGVSSIIVYLNQCDCGMDEGMLWLMEDEIRELLTACGFPGDTTPIIRGSALQALQGESGEYGMASIQKLLDTLDAYIPDPAKPFLMPIEHTRSVTGRGTAVVGKVVQGKVKIGDEIEIVGAKESRKTVVTAIQMSGSDVPDAHAGFDAEIFLHNIGIEDVERGMVLAKPGSITSHRKFIGFFYLFEEQEGGRKIPFFAGFRTQFSFFKTIDVTGTFTNLLDPVDRGNVLESVSNKYRDVFSSHIDLLVPVPMTVGLKFIVTEHGGPIGAGSVVEIIE